MLIQNQVPRNESCHLCREGHYCGSATTSLSMMTTGGGDWNNAGDLSGVCFDGTVCPVGMDRAPNLINDACPAGHYCTLGRKQECPGGTYNPFIGGMNLTSCLLTPPGHYSISSSENVTGLCNPGHYCPLKMNLFSNYFFYLKSFHTIYKYLLLSQAVVLNLIPRARIC